LAVCSGFFLELATFAVNMPFIDFDDLGDRGVSGSTLFFDLNRDPNPDPVIVFLLFTGILYNNITF
jgi:hypothetical protein